MHSEHYSKLEPDLAVFIIQLPGEPHKSPKQISIELILLVFWLFREEICGFPVCQLWK
jgi:hypothetical protein